MGKRALVTIAIGDKYFSKWKRYCKSSWYGYADKYDLDVLCIKEPLDTSDRAQNRNPSWQKCLLASHPKIKEYDQVLWIDSDIVINVDKSPNIFDGVPLDKVGGVSYYDVPTKHLNALYQNRIIEIMRKQNYDFKPERTPAEYYENYGLSNPPSKVLHCGLMVFSPKHHGETFQYVYDNYEQVDRDRYEMRPLSYHLVNEGVVKWIDPKFNTLWLIYKALYYPFLFQESKSDFGLIERLVRKMNKLFVDDKCSLEVCVNSVMHCAYFLHFAGAIEDMELWKDSGDIV